jgi:hypothetical protein
MWYCMLPAQVLVDQMGRLPETPPQFLPSIYRGEYLLDGHVELQSLPRSEVYNGNPQPLEWSRVRSVLHPTARSQHPAACMVQHRSMRRSRVWGLRARSRRVPRMLLVMDAASAAHSI